MRISAWSSDVCSSDPTATTRRRRLSSSTPCNSRDATHGTCTDEPDSAPIHESTIAERGTAHAANPAEPAGMSISPAEQTKLDSRRLRGSLLESLADPRSEEHTTEPQSLMRLSYAVFCL